MLYATYIAETLGTARESKNAVAMQERDIQLYLEHFADSSLEDGGKLTGGSVLHDWLFSESNPHRYFMDILAGEVYVLVAYLTAVGRSGEEITKVIDKLQGRLLVAELPGASADELKVVAKLEDSRKKFMGLRSKAGIEQAKAEGKQIGGLREKTEELNKQRKQEAAKQAAEIKAHLVYCRNEGYSLQKTADHLNAKGFRTAQGKEFKPMTVKRYIDRLTS